ncbi:hypothetical protein AALB19_05435 [Oscillospiraceae bacterium 50-58]
MPDYQKMYLTMARANAQAVDILIKVRLECEELYISSPEPEVTALEFNPQSPLG